jgi:malate dehydrogenase (oxaloacetate-decarboxylating)
MLDRYRKVLPSFNDDIQGTGAVVLAGILAAARITGVPLQRQRVVILGAGAAGIGIARQIRDALARAGLAGDDLTRALALVDVRGVARATSRPTISSCPSSRPAELAHGLGLTGRRPASAVVRLVKPTAPIGARGGGASARRCGGDGLPCRAPGHLAPSDEPERGGAGWT